jgi:predicted  nucleic acid-binding Zn-ribbon protein
VLGATQASALPQVQMEPWPRFLLVQAAEHAEPTVRPPEQPGAQAQADPQAPLTELNEVLEATQAKLDELFGATEGMAELRAETELLRHENERLAGALEQVSGRLSELESSSKRAEAQIEELTNASDVVTQKAAGLDEELAEVRRENADLEARLARADSAREAAQSSVEQTRTEMQQTIKRSSAEAERLNSELAAVKEQLGEATTAGAQAERAGQLAVSEAQQLRGEAERASAELIAARSELERLRPRTGELERQLASLHADSKSAVDTTRQTLIIMEEKIGELSAALAGAGLAATTWAPAAMATPSGGAQAPPQKPGDTGGADQRADISDQELTTAPAQADDASALMRFDADVRYLNSQASGADLFSDIESPGDGVVLVSTTAAWHNISPAGQRSYLNSLFNLWTVAQEGSGPTVVRILDPRGRVLLEKSDRD